jgi:phosphate transport system ATP-binding protein
MEGAKIRVSNLDFSYGRRQVLSGISIDILENQVTALIGPAGGGKSTFLRCLNRMNEVIPGARVKGQILLDGRNIHDPAFDVLELRCRVGMVFQRSNPFPKSVFDNVAFGLRINGWKDPYLIEKRVQQSLEGAALWEEVKDRLQSPALELSNGQRQQLCIARTLAVEPEVILLDDPAGALDPLATARIEELIRSLSQRYTIVLVTHNLQEAARASSRTAFFLSGRLIEVSDTQQIFTNPSCQETEDYVTGRFG